MQLLTHWGLNKMVPFCIHFQKHFSCMLAFFTQIWLKIVRKSSQQHVSIGSGNGLSPIWWQAITWTNVDILCVLIHLNRQQAIDWTDRDQGLSDHMVALCRNKLRQVMIKQHVDLSVADIDPNRPHPSMRGTYTVWWGKCCYHGNRYTKHFHQLGNIYTNLIQLARTHIDTESCSGTPAFSV